MFGNPEIVITLLEVTCVGSVALGVAAGAIIWSLKKFSGYERGIREEVDPKQL